MNDYQALAIPTLILLAIVGGALVGWALREWRQAKRVWSGPFQDARSGDVRGFDGWYGFRDNPDPSDSAGA